MNLVILGFRIILFPVFVIDYKKIFSYKLYIFPAEGADIGVPANMADEEVLDVNGRPINDLRVTDLKKELDKRGLSKSGNKKELVERLKAVSIPSSHVI